MIYPRSHWKPSFVFILVDNACCKNNMFVTRLMYEIINNYSNTFSPSSLWVLFDCELAR